MFHASMEQRDNGTFSEILCVCFDTNLPPKDDSLTNVNAQGRELFLSFKVQRQSTGSWKVITIQSWIAGKKSIQSMETSG
jgi:hypothetical protein